MKRIYLIITILSAFCLFFGCKADGGQYFKVAPVDNINYNNNGGSTIISVDSDMAWNVESSQDWCQIISRTSRYFTIYAGENTTNEDRPEAIVRVYILDGGGSREATIKVTQSAGETYLYVITDGEIEFEANGGQKTITIETNYQDDLDINTSNAIWCGVEIAPSNVITLEAQPNRGLRREGVIKIAAGNVLRELRIHQQGEANSDLSINGTANCYIIESLNSGKYSFNATVIGNGSAGMTYSEGYHTESINIQPKSAKLLWQDFWEDGQGAITEVTLNESGEVEFIVNEHYRPGNAVIAVYDDEGNILWSWHIWMVAQNINSEMSETGYDIMNINLGVVESAAKYTYDYGLLYQWGRKDPFPAASTPTGNTSTLGKKLYDIEGKEVKIANSSWTDTSNNTLTYAIENPTVCLSNKAQYASSRDWLADGTEVDALWGNPEGSVKNENNEYVNKGVKSIYDPCPVGWRVPPADVFSHFTTSGGYAWADAEDNVPDFNIEDVNKDSVKSIADYDHGWRFMINENTSSYFPAAARYDGSYAMLMGSVSGLWGSYWGNAPGASDLGFKGMGFSVISFQIEDGKGAKMITASPNGAGSRADAYSIRCIRE